MSTKRKPNSHTGATPETKEARKNDEREERTYAEVTTVTAETIAASLAKKVGLHEGSVSSGFTTASKKSQRNPFKGQEMGNQRDQILVDIPKIDGYAFKDQLTDKEQNLIAYKLGIVNTNVSGIAPGFTNGHPTYTYRLYKLMHINDINFEEIKIKRTQVDDQGNKYKAEILCKARGNVPTPKANNESGLPMTRWIKIEDTQYKLDGQQIRTWLEQFGNLQTEIEEEGKPGSQEDPDDDPDLSEGEKEYLKGMMEVGSGILTTKMILYKNMPQYLPMFGRKIRIYYKGIERTCTNCYGNGHIRRGCPNKKRQWISYVMDFMNLNPEIPIDIYGRWAKVVAEELQKEGYKPNEAKKNQNENQTETTEGSDEEVDGTNEELTQDTELVPEQNELQETEQFQGEKEVQREQINKTKNVETQEEEQTQKESEVSKEQINSDPENEKLELVKETEKATKKKAGRPAKTQKRK